MAANKINVSTSENKIVLLQSQTNKQNIDDLHAKAEVTHEMPNWGMKGVSFADEKKEPKIEQSSKYSPTASVFMRTGYKVTTKIATTMQGSVYNAVNMDGQRCVLKRTSVRLHNMGVACINKKLYKVKENIVNEAAIMEYLTSLNPPAGLTKLIDFFCDGKNYFLLMEHGGQSFFKHVTGFHKRIKNGELKLKTWKQHVKILFKQMCKFVNWMHNVAKLAHLDISLENMLIKGCVFKNGKFISHGQVNFIDFGLSERYPDKKSFDNCTKYVGKQNYKSPELYHKIPFNAAKSDIWSLGVILFMLTFGLKPYSIPKNNDTMFEIIFHDNIKFWAKHTGKSKRVSKELLNIFSHIFCDENDRYTINKLIKHKYVR